MFKGFRDFIMRGNVVDLAVAVIIGAAFNQIVNSMVGDVLTPLIGAIFGRPDFSGIVIGPIFLGKFINAIVNFLIVAIVIYFGIVVPMKKLQERIDKKKAAQPASAPSEEVRLLSEILETLKNK
ncbi:MAG: large conductance mechanosensitive channel protein MscL [Candidatus Saccharicenans sp.]|jgi:large conductance mechanosensitive channel|nr:large conductance mechanosensitive channel protein MscL [Candidatus Saccharicenans sp.]NMC65142.1 large conductance mechanosensitive channel protein MscL [Acidobacteriota bacterium]